MPRWRPAGSSPCPTSPGELGLVVQRVGRSQPSSLRSPGTTLPTFLPCCPSVAKCLGAKTVAARALECAQECRVISQVVEDTEAVRALEQFLGEQGPAGHGGGDRGTAGSRHWPGTRWSQGPMGWGRVGGSGCPPALIPADDERMLVQPACGAALACLYTGRLQRLQRGGRLPTPLASVVVVVCGGGNIQLAQLRALKSQLGLE